MSLHRPKGCENLKKFIKGRWFPLSVAFSLAIVVAFVMGSYGWRLTYPSELEINWDAISAVAAWAGAIGTVAVLVYNHKAINLTQRSIQQAIDLQLFEKRLELYNAIGDDTAFYNAPLSLKIAYNDEIYLLYSEIVELCEKRWRKIWEFAELFRVIGLQNREHGNVCHELYKEYSKQIENELRIRKAGAPVQDTDDGKVISLENHKADTDLLYEAICKKYAQLEEKMKTTLNQSID